MKINNRWKIIFIASFFAWLLEYSLRGINGFLKQPAMAILVFANYFFYLALIEEFIGRFKLKDYQVWIVAQFFGLIWQLVSIAVIYEPPFLFRGLGTLLINNLVWWPTMQTLFAFYIARRLTDNIDRSKPFLSKNGIFCFFTLYILVSLSWRLFYTPPVTAWKFLMILILTSFFGWLFYQQISHNIKKGIQLVTFEKDKLLDWLAVFTIVYLVFSFFFLTGDVDPSAVINKQALGVNLVVSPLIAFALLLKRLISKKPIPV
jgi:hypothetical protein